VEEKHGDTIVRRNVVTPHITRLFGHMHAGAYLPRPYRLNTMSALHKSGPRMLCSNYRGITVGSTVGKLYSGCINTRLAGWAEQQELRAPTQAGFREGMGLNGLLVMTHVIEKYRVLGQPVYACMIDFKTAFDCVQRDLLWERLQHLGVAGAGLAAIKSMYEEVSIRVKAGGSRSTPFKSVQGVKQGDPSSPTLFGLFVETFHEMLERYCAGTGPLVDGLNIMDLLYADDVILLALTPEGLQAQLDVLNLFCLHFNMKANLLKTEAIVFRRSAQQTWPLGTTWTVGGEAVRVVEQVVYLGMEFHAFKKIKPWAGRLMTKGIRACAGLKDKLRALQVSQPELMVRLFDDVVAPSVNYGCQIWGPGHWRLDDVSKALNDFDRFQINFLRYISGCNKSVSCWVLLGDFSVVPMQTHWVRAVAKFWNAVVAKPGWLAHRAMKESHALAAASTSDSQRNRFWSGRVVAAMRGIGVPTDDDFTACRFLPGLVDDGMAQFHNSIWDPVKAVDPDMFSGTGAKLAVFYHYMRDEVTGPDKKSSWGTRTFAPHLSTPELFGYPFQILMRFRTCCWPIEVNVGRHVGIPREQRLCKHCVATGAGSHVEDEKHVMLSCTKYDTVRRKDKYKVLFEDPDMNKIMNFGDAQLVAQLVFEIWRLRKPMMP
jgi:Reverse transcriptase (RNA-dependent DNA polymerase)